AEIACLRERTESSDDDLLKTQEMVIKLNENIAHLQRENSMLKQRDGATEDPDVVNIIHNMEEKHSRDMSDLETLIQAQNGLLDNLRGECKMLTGKLEDTSKQYRNERSVFASDKMKLIQGNSTTAAKNIELLKKIQYYVSNQEQMSERIRKMEQEDQIRSDRVTQSLKLAFVLFCVFVGKI
ncbi:unnamed protein product, partial [Allacma fusca]